MSEKAELQALKAEVEVLQFAVTELATMQAETAKAISELPVRVISGSDLAEVRLALLRLERRTSELADRLARRWKR